MKRKFKKIVYTGGLNWLPFAPDHMGIRQGFKDLGVEAYVLDDVIDYKGAAELAAKIVEINPDLVIYGETRPMGRGVPRLINRGIKGLQVFWMMDYRPKTDSETSDYDGGWNNWRASAPYIDALILSNKEQLQWWADDWALPTAYLPHACYIPKKLIFNKKFKVPNVFIGGRNEGGWYRDRVKLIDEIKSRTEITWTDARDSEERNKIWKDMPAIYHSADTVLDISHSWISDGYCSGRYFYTATLGGCCITKRFPSCEDLFPEGTKRYFDTADEAVELIKYYVKHEKEREALKIKTAKYAWKNHSYKIRFEQLFEILNSLSL